MPLDPQAQALLVQMATQPAWYEVPLDEARQQRVLSTPLMNGIPDDVKHVEDRKIPGEGGDIAVRIYIPEGDGPFPVLVYFHGGGWVLSNCDTHDPLCRKLANRATCIIVSVDYRLAPEHKFPAAVEDAYAATCWVAENAKTLNGDPARIAVGGDSAGGNLASVVALMARDQNGPSLIYQLLIYPATDYYPTGTEVTQSYRDNAEGYFLTAESIARFWKHYLNSDEDGNDFRVAPLRATHLRGLPSALVITAEYDPLRDEGEIYAERLREAGVSVTLKRYNGMIHGFFNMSAVLDQGQRAIDDAAALLKEAFAGK